MTKPVLYSTNPWFSHQVAMNYRDGKHFAWCSEYFDPRSTDLNSTAQAIAPSSSPKGIYDQLHSSCETEDGHCTLISNYKKTFRRLAKVWLSETSISQNQYDEIISLVQSTSWKMWRPVLYVIPKEPIISSKRLLQVERKERAALGPEYKIVDLNPAEFDLIRIY